MWILIIPKASLTENPVVIYFTGAHRTSYRGIEAEALQKYFQEHVDKMVLDVKEEAK